MSYLSGLIAFRCLRLCLITYDSASINLHKITKKFGEPLRSLYFIDDHPPKKIRETTGLPRDHPVIAPRGGLIDTREDTAETPQRNAMR